MCPIDHKPIRDETKQPICPHCEKPFSEIRYFEQSGKIAMKVARVYVCPHCLKVLGVGAVGM